MGHDAFNAKKLHGLGKIDILQTLYVVNAMQLTNIQDCIVGEPMRLFESRVDARISERFSKLTWRDFSIPSISCRLHTDVDPEVRLISAEWFIICRHVLSFPGFPQKWYQRTCCAR